MLQLQVLHLASQSKHSTSRPTQATNGTGLGLASSRVIVETGGGTIGFEDVAGGGACFWFCCRPPHGGQQHMTAAGKDTKKKPTIYIVDDDDGMRRALTALMTGVGYHAVPFARPREFLAKFDPKQPGCLVLDVHMPEMSGLEVQEHLNRSGSLVPVILITGHSDTPMVVQAMKDGAFDFLQKPFRNQELLDRINAALKQDAENRAVVERRADLKARGQP